MTLQIAITNDINTCRALRRTVFIEEQGVSEADEIDDLDGEATHFLALLDRVPVGSARLLEKDSKLKIGRVCVLPAHRRNGIGKALIREALNVGRAQGFKTAMLGAQVTAIAFYEQLGFTAYGPKFDDAGIAHRNMACPL